MKNLECNNPIVVEIDKEDLERILSTMRYNLPKYNSYGMAYRRNLELIRYFEALLSVNTHSTGFKQLSLFP